MSLRHGILGLLAGRPMSGYELTRAFDESLRFVWSASHSQIYPELARLNDDGLIEQAGEGPRGKRIYRVTSAGRQELRYWLTETEPDRSSRSEATMRFFFLWLLTPNQATSLLLKEREYHRVDLERYNAMLAQQHRGEKAPRWGRRPLELGIAYKKAMLQWIEGSLRQLGEPAKRRQR